MAVEKKSEMAIGSVIGRERATQQLTSICDTLFTQFETLHKELTTIRNSLARINETKQSIMRTLRDV